MIPMIGIAVLVVLVVAVIGGTYLADRAERSRERAAGSVERIVRHLDDRPVARARDRDR